jgi:glyoxylase-like metal-dependent hydrolase (beta-lactamase superfamily II)
VISGVQPVSRRVFLADLGRGAAAIAIVSLAACAPASSGTAAPTRTASASSSTPPSGSPGASATPGASGSNPPTTAGLRWERVNLGFVSAYLLIRGGEVAIVDTGVAGSEDEIEGSLGAVGLGWDAVGHVIVTHKHGDHAGSLEAIVGLAAAARVYAGAEDIPSISSARTPTAVADGDDVFGLTIVTTPGHTPGSISVHDPLAGVFVAGDALRTDGRKPAPPGGQFTEDMAAAMTSIAKIGALTFETLLVGHGEPIETGAAALVAQLATVG